MQYSTPETRASLILRLPDAGDVAAWDGFVSIYGPVILRVASKQGLQAADAENVVQEVMLRVAKSVGNWLERKDRGPFRAWLRRIAQNEALRLLSRQATHPLAEFHDGHPGAIGDQSQQLQARLEMEYCREVFLWAAELVRQEVAEATWQAFWLTHVEGLSIPEAADKLGVKTGNIYFGRSRVMNRLKLVVQGFEEV